MTNGQTAKDPSTSMRDEAKEFVDTARDTAGKVYDKVRDAAESARDTAKDKIDVVSDTVRERPLLAIAVAFIGGALFASIFRR